jgi:hypothetical protein
MGIEDRKEAAAKLGQQLIRQGFLVEGINPDNLLVFPDRVLATSAGHGRHVRIHPREKLTAEQLVAIEEYKAELVEWLEALPLWTGPTQMVVPSPTNQDAIRN